MVIVEGSVRTYIVVMAGFITIEDFYITINIDGAGIFDVGNFLASSTFLAPWSPLAH